MANVRTVYEAKSLQESFDDYLINHQGTTTRVDYTTPDGDITYYADKDHPFDGINVMIYYIGVKPELQHQGRFKGLLQHIVDNKVIRSIRVLAICSFILDEYLGRTTHLSAPWIIHGADRIWTRPV